MKRSVLSNAATLLASTTLFACACAYAQTPQVDAKSDAQVVANAESEKEDAAPKKSKGDDFVVSGRKLVKLAPGAKFASSTLAKDGAAEPQGKLEAPREIVGREVVDYRTQSGVGRYVLEDELGFIRIIPGESIESIEDAPDVTLGELRKTVGESLVEEFGPRFSIKASERYIFVYDSSDGYAEWCARLFESLADGFERFAARNDFALKERVEPMVVVVFATQGEFIRYASKETPSADKIAAYYNMETNRVVLYDLSETEGTANAANKRKRAYLETKEFLSRPNAAFNVATIVHEATHQIAYDRGLFHRTGPFALWAVEGLSLVFETPNGKASQGGWGYRGGSFPTNERQLTFFRNFVGTTTQNDPIRDLIRQDKFMVDVQGSYATSWALFYYLYKKRPKELAAYVKEVSARPPYSTYSPEDRVADFEKFFGNDWKKLTENVVRFARRL